MGFSLHIKQNLGYEGKLFYSGAVQLPINGIGISGAHSGWQSIRCRTARGIVR